MKLLMLFLALLLHHSIAYPSVQSDNNSQDDDNSKIKPENDNNESSKKIIGSSVVTSVSVILNGEDQPQFTDAVGHRIPKPQVPLQVASPINLLNPDRYEFYTFDNNGQLVKRIMTLQEIHSIVANGDGDGGSGSTIIHHNTQIDDRDPNKNVQDIVDSVQNVLTKEVEWKKNLSNPDNQHHHQMLDTPDVSSSWSMILPAIFGNTGDDIFSSNNRPPQQVVMTPDSDVVENTTKPSNKRKPIQQKPIKSKPIITNTVRPLHEYKPIHDDFINEMNTPLIMPQKIFVNNKEIIKPLFNRNDIKNDSTDSKIELTTTTLKPSITISTTKIKKLTTKQKTKPIKITTIQSDIIPEVTTKRITPQNKRKPTTTITVPISESTTLKYVSTQNKLSTSTKLVHNKHKLTTTIPATTSTETISTKKIEKQSTTTTTAVPSLDEIIQITEKVQLINNNKKKPSTTTQTTPILPTTAPTTKKVIKRKQTTTRKPPSTTTTTTASAITTSAVTTTEQPTEKITTTDKLPLSKTAGQLSTTETTSVTESSNKIMENENSSTAGNTITDVNDDDLMNDKDTTTTVALNSIVNSLMLQQNNEDINTKLSFDQIMESLQDKNNKPTTENNINNKKTTVPIKKLPILYNNNNNNLLIKPIQKIPLILTTEEPMPTTTFIPEYNENIDMTTYSSSSNLESIEIDDANAVKFDPLYAELLDPILTQLTTSTESLLTTDLPTDSLMTTTSMPPSIKESISPSDKLNIINYNLLSDDTKTENILQISSSETADSNSNSHSSELTQKVEEFIANNMKNTEDEKVYIKLQNPEINYFNQESEMNMKDLQKEIATVASMLDDHPTTINPMNKLNNNSADEEEIQALLSDVYNQITNTPLIPTNIISSTAEENSLKHDSNNEDSNNNDAASAIELSSNRFTNLAQMNTSILLPPKQDITQQLNSNDKFHLLETLALKLNETNNQDYDNNHENDDLPIGNLNKIIYTSNFTDGNNNKIVIEQKNNLINSNSMNLNKNANNAIELNGIITTTERILPIGYKTTSEKIENTEMDIVEDENVSSSTGTTEFTSNEKIDDNIFDSSTTIAVKIIESLIKTTVQPLIENNNIIKTTTDENSQDENLQDETTILYNNKNSEIESINDNDDDNISMDLHKNSEKENNFSNEMLTTTMKIDTDIKNNIKIDEITENSSEKLIENIENNSEEKLDETTTVMNEKIELNTEYYNQDQSTEVLMELVPLITKPSSTEKSNIIIGTPSPTPQTTDIFNITETEQIYIKLGESTQRPQNLSTTTMTPTNEDVTLRLTIIPQTPSPIKRKPTLKPIHYFKQPNSQSDQKLMTFNGNQQRPVVRPAALTNLKITQISSATRSPVKLEPSPEQSLGLEASTLDLQEDIQEFARLCNELAFNYWRSITAEKISNARSLVLSPFALTSMLSMVFLGARGSTSGEMNEILRLDDMVTFNPHLVFKNITESVEHAKDSDIASSAFVREIFSDRSNGKILPFFKEKVQQIYSGHVEEVNFNVVNDIIRRRTNLLIKRHTGGKVMEYLRTNSVWVNGPLSTVTANLFQTDCSRGSITERDGEMFFQVHPSVRQRRLVPIPAVVWRTGFTAGYDPELDATVVAFGSTDETVSTIYVMPGQHGLAAPGDNLERLESNIMENGITKNVWSHLLTSLMQRPGLEVQLPRFSHRSFVNASIGLQKLGLKALFNSDMADLGGLTGSSKKDIYLSDMIQINTFSTCGEEKISDHHHVEMYPAPPLRKRNSDIGENDSDFMDIEQIDFGSIVHDTAARGFYDDLLDPKYLELPLPLRPRQARIPDSPRLRFDKPFLYFVRHNPTGMILFMGRFNPRLLP